MADVEDTGYEAIIDEVMELIGRAWKRSQIINHLVTEAGMKRDTASWLIKLARIKIRRHLNIDPDEYRGRAIEHYQSIIRNCKSTPKYAIMAQRELDKICGLDSDAGSHEDYCEKLREAVLAMGESIPNKEGQASQVKTKETKIKPDPFVDIIDEYKDSNGKVDSTPLSSNSEETMA